MQRKNPLVLSDYRSYCDSIADMYDALPAFDEDEAWRWDVLIEHIERFYEKLRKQVKVKFVPGQPYEDAEGMREQVLASGVLLISKDANEHPLWTPTQNLKFRAVHDYVGHILPGARGPDFSRRGEMRAYNLHRKLVPKDAIPALFTEVAGQACYANARGEFPTQKIAVFPDVDFYRIGEVHGEKVDKPFVGLDRELIPRKASRKNPSRSSARIQYLFCYGSNSTRQLEARLGIPGGSRGQVQGAYAPDYQRVFRGMSSTWGGGTASLQKKKGAATYGLLVELSARDLDVLDRYEGVHSGVYKRQKLLVYTQDGEPVEAIAYVSLRKDFNPPTKEYLAAVVKTISRFWEGENGPVTAKDIPIR